MEPLEARTEPRFPKTGSYTRSAGGYLSAARGAELRAAISQLYVAFADATLCLPFRACPHCFTPSDVEYVVKTPRQAFSHGDLSLIAAKLISTLGGPEDVAYFAPRILEALAEGALIEIEPFADRLAQMPEQMWTAERTKALSETFTLLFAATKDTWDDLGSEATRVHLQRVLPTVVRSDRG